MTILSYILVLPLILGGVGITGYAAAELRIRTLLHGRTHSVVGMVTGFVSMVLALATIIVDGIVPDVFLVASTAALATGYGLMYGWFTRAWAVRKTKGMSGLVRHHTLKAYRHLGFDHARLMAVVGNHKSNPPQLRGYHMPYAKRDFVRSLPSPELHPATEADLSALIWAAVRSRDDESIAYLAPDLSAVFEEVYRDLLYFSGKLTPENLRSVIDTAGVYGIDAAKHAVGGDMPVEYLSALGVEPLPPRRQLWFEKADEQT